MRNTKTYRLISAHLLALLALLLCGATTITAAPGDLDPTFGIGGLIYPPSGSQTPYSEGNDIVVQPDQKILVSGPHFNNSNREYGLLVSRYLPNGTLDPTFGVGGQIFQGNGGGGGKLALQPDGRILVFSGFQGGSILRYKPDGNLDTTFDGDGALPFSAFSAYRLAVQNDGKIIVAGTKYVGPGNYGDPSLFALVRLNSDGSFDTAFGSNGIVTTTFPYTSSYMGDIVIQADGKIVAAGSTSNINGNGTCNPCNIALSRYNIDGSLDTSFGTSGRVLTPGGPYNVLHGSDLTLQADNKIVVAGHYSGSYDVGGLVIRYMPDGLQDASFGEAGQVSIPNLCPFSIAVQSNSKIVVAGGTTSYDPSNSSHELGRLLSNGVLDPTFGTNGRVTTVFPNLPRGFYINGRAWGMAIQRDGKIVTAGYWSGTDWDGNSYWSYVAVARFLGDATPTPTPTPTCPNPIDCADFFVRQHYQDFLNREPDAPGLAHWAGEITACDDASRRQPGESLAQCSDRKRTNTSAAFFLSPEFQYTGYFVYRLYKGSLTQNGVGRFATYQEFLRDVRQVASGIIQNNQLSAPVIEENKKKFAEEFVKRAEFRSLYDPLSNFDYVERLFQITGITVSAAEKQALINGLNNQTETRASVLQKAVDGAVVMAEGNQQFTTSYGRAFYEKEFNAAFVLMEYFGYLKRDPDAAGYQHWMDKLNLYGNYQEAEMVKSFITSPEYRARFGQPQPGT